MMSNMKYLIAILCLLSCVTCSSFPKHAESLEIHTLKIDSSEQYFNRLTNYTYKASQTPGQSSEGYKEVFFKKTAALKNLNYFRLTFALGSLNYEEKFTLNRPLPKFGSFFVVNTTNEEEFINTGFLVGGFFSLANDRITKFERLNIPEQQLYWYSYSAEHFCVDHIYKLLKFWPAGGLKTLFEDPKYNPFRYSYASVEIEYRKDGNVLSPESGRQTLQISLYTAIPDSTFSGFMRIPFTPIDALDPEDSEQATTSIIDVNHYMERETKVLLNSGQDALTLKQAFDSQKELANQKSKMVRKKYPVTVSRFIRGKIASFTNTLVTRVRNEDLIDFEITLTAVFDSHQYAFLSDVTLFDDKGSQRFDFNSRYLKRLSKPHGNLGINTIEMKFNLGPGESVEVRVPYLINMRKLAEYEQEYERGTYLLGSVLVASDGDSSYVVSMPPVQTNEKQIDSTFAFTTLTVNNVIFFILPITFMFFGINTK